MAEYEHYSLPGDPDIDLTVYSDRVELRCQDRERGSRVTEISGDELQYLIHVLRDVF